MSHDAAADLTHFEAYVETGRAPRWTMAPSDIHGFLTALAMDGSVPEAAWLPLIWSGEEPLFESAEEEASVIGEVRQLHSRIATALDAPGGDIVPLLLASDDGRYFAADWAQGFLQAIEINPPAWSHAFECARDSLEVVLAACYENHDEHHSGILTAAEASEMVSHLNRLHALMRGTQSSAHREARAA